MPHDIFKAQLFARLLPAEQRSSFTDAEQGYNNNFFFFFVLCFVFSFRPPPHRRRRRGRLSLLLHFRLNFAILHTHHSLDSSVSTLVSGQ